MPPRVVLDILGKKRSLASARIQKLYCSIRSLVTILTAFSAYDLHRKIGVALGIGTALKFGLLMKHVFYATLSFVR